jgi:tRNA1(Val) A37 N6-methylase TrmN6
MHATSQVFEFRHFSIRHELTAMKIGTDAMLLGSWVRPGAAKHMLDIGTGTGVLALMLAQRAQPGAVIHAIDIEAAAVQQAKGNAAACTWHQMLSVFHISIQDLCQQHRQLHQPSPSAKSATDSLSSEVELSDKEPSIITQPHTPTASSSMQTAGIMASMPPQQACDHHAWPEHYDLIISNPPFFQRSYKAPQQQRAIARHADITLPFQDLADGVAQLLAPHGRVCCILPPAEAKSLIALMEDHQMQLRRLLRVKGRAGQVQDKRWVMEFARLPSGSGAAASVEEEELVCNELCYVERLGASKDVYTQQYREMTQEFHHPKYFQH